MIGKIIIGTSFSNCINYVFLGRKEDQQKFRTQGIQKSTLLSYNLCFGPKNDLIEQFNEVRKLNHKVSRAVSHTIISFAEEDTVSDQQMIEIAFKLSIKMNFDKHQYVAVKHNDTGHQHLHIVSNRISCFSGKTLSDSNNFKIISGFCREMEKEYGFREVLSPKRFLPKEQRNTPRHDSRFEACKKIVHDVLKDCQNWDDLQYDLLAKGIMMEKGRGVAFIDDKAVRIKGSKIGFSFDRIDALLNKNQKVFEFNEPSLKTRIRL